VENVFFVDGELRRTIGFELVTKETITHRGQGPEEFERLPL
jgi:hypothetical protein